MCLPTSPSEQAPHGKSSKAGKNEGIPCTSSTNFVLLVQHFKIAFTKTIFKQALIKMRYRTKFGIRHNIVDNLIARQLLLQLAGKTYKTSFCNYLYFLLHSVREKKGTTVGAWLSLCSFPSGW